MPTNIINLILYFSRNRELYIRNTEDYIIMVRYYPSKGILQGSKLRINLFNLNTRDLPKNAENMLNICIENKIRVSN